MCVAVSRADVITLLKMVFSTLTVAMRYEPANARFFSTEVRCDFINFVVGLKFYS